MLNKVVEALVTAEDEADKVSPKAKVASPVMAKYWGVVVEVQVWSEVNNWAEAAWAAEVP